MKKRGRNKMLGSHPREPNGRLSRRVIHVAERTEMTEREARSVMVAARMKMTGLPEDWVAKGGAGRPDAGTVHGILRLQKMLDDKTPHGLSAHQWDAAEWFIAARRNYLKAILARTGQGGEGPSHGMPDSDSYIDWCERATSTWQRVLSVIGEESVRSRTPIMSALDVMLLRQQHLDHLVGDLRIGLNAIHREFLAGRKAY